MKNNRYGNIDELISEIEALGDWKDSSQRSNFFRVLSKIAVIYNGYEIKNENGEETRDYYPKEVFEAIVEACKGKFPTKDQVFDEQGQLKPWCPEYSNYLVLVNDASGISLMGEKTEIDEIAREEFGIDVFHRTATREEVDGLIVSSKVFLEKRKTEKQPSEIEKQAKITSWIEQGKAYIYPERLKKWKELVEDLARDYGEENEWEYKGWEKLQAALALMEKLESGASIEEAKEMFNQQDYTVVSAGTVRSILFHFSKRGPEFYESTAGGELSEEERKEIEDKKWENDKIEAWHSKMTSWIEQGKAYIYPERLEKWKEFVASNDNRFANGSELEAALALMEKLESGASIEEVKEMFNQQEHVAYTAGIVRSILFHFSKRGPEFYESTAGGELSEEDRNAIEDKKRENAKFEALHSLAEEVEHLQRENEELKTENEKQGEQIKKLQSMLERALDFVTRVRDSVVGKLFFKKPLQELNMDGQALPKGEDR